MNHSWYHYTSGSVASQPVNVSINTGDCIDHEVMALLQHLHNATHLRRSIHYESCRARSCRFLALDGHCILGMRWSIWRNELTILQGWVDYFTQGWVGLGTRCPTAERFDIIWAYLMHIFISCLLKSSVSLQWCIDHSNLNFLSRFCISHLD